MKASFAKHFSTLLIFIDILASISILATIIDTTTDNLAFAFKPAVPPTNDTQEQPLQELPPPSMTKDEATPVSKQRADAITSTSLSQFLTYENATYGIKMDYPSNWITSGYNLTDPTTNIASFYSPEPWDYVRVNIYLENLSKSYSTLPQLYEYLGLSIDGYKLYREVWPGFKLNSSSSDGITLAGNPAYVLTGTYNDPRYGIRHIMDTGTILDDKGYFIQYLGTPIKYEQYLPIVQQMINSFEIARGVQEPVEEQDAMTTFEEEGGLLSNNSGVSNSLSEEASIHGDSLSSEQQHPIMVKKHSFTSTYPLSVECMVICKTFPIRYNISNGNLDSITYDESGSPSLFIISNSLNSSDEYAKLTIEIPRTILDSRESNGNRDRDFMVLNAYSNREIYNDSYSRILEIVLYGPAQNPAIIGTTSSQSNPLASR